MQKHYNYLNINLDKKIHTKLKAKQGDSKSRYILVNLISNNLYYDLTGTTVKIYGVKKDKTIFFNHATIVDAKQGQFEIELTTQALAVVGEIEIQILILGTNQEKLTTFSFFIDVEKTIIDDAAIESTNEFTALTEALSSVQNIDNKFAKVDEQFNTKANKNEIFSMANMGQDVKEAMTGGSVAIVGNGGVLNQNIAPSQVSVDKTDFIEIGKNKFNVNNRSKLGEWCNYTNGNIESTEYVTTFYHTGYESILPSTQYTRKYGTDGTSFFDINREFISGTTENTFTTPSNAMYVIYNFQNYHLDEQVELGSVSTEYEPYRLIFNNFKSNSPILYTPTLKNPVFEGEVIIPKDIVTIGTGGQYEKVSEGLEYAYQNNKEAIILPGIYDIVAEGANLQSGGINLPRKVYGYGATIIANLPTENWTFSPLFVPYKSNYNIELYGLTVICSNCRYCLHDDLGSFSNYHHKFKDLTLIQNSNISQTLTMPRAIGGGTGSNGYIEIDNCILASNTPADVDYHSDWQGTQTGDTIIKCNNSVFKTTITGTSIGSDSSFKNKLYVSNCLCGTELPKLNSNENFEIKQWNNVIM